MTPIINEDKLLEDSIEVLTDSLGLPDSEAVGLLPNDKMQTIIGLMYRAQEEYLQELYIQHKKTKKDTNDK